MSLVYECSLHSAAKVLLDLVIITPQVYYLLVFGGVRVFSGDIASVRMGGVAVG